jgi:hypothetical protein
MNLALVDHFSVACDTEISLIDFALNGFLSDINNQGSTQQELYWVMNAGHEQTEAYYRMGFYGPWVSLLGGWQVLINW